MNKLTYVGEDPLIWKVDEWIDDISKIALDTTGPYDLFCEDRQHTILSIVSATGDANYVSPTSPPVVEINEEYLFFILNAPDSTYIGVHTVTVEVKLHNYSPFNNQF